MEKVIKLAKERGNYFWDPAFDCECVCENSYVMDINFWQALGKALNWPEIKQPYQTGNGDWLEIFWWEYKWHEFIHHLAKGKDAKSFFTSLTEQES